MAILVTGVCGMIGGQVAERLRARGEEVVGYDVRAPEENDRVPGVTYVRGDLNDPPRLYQTFRRHSIRQVVHAGAISAPFIEADNPYLVCQTNILGTLSLFEAARTFEVARLANFSSESAYGRAGVPTLNEDTPFQPDSIYGVTKATSDFLGRVYRRQHGLEVISLRPSLVYGPRRPSYEPVRDLIRGALVNRAVALPAPADLIFGGVYARDVATLVLAILDAPRVPRDAYNVTSGQRFTLVQVAEAVRRHLPTLQVRFESGEPAALPPVMDFSAATDDLGFHPEWPLDRAIPDYVEWLRGHDV